jgi:hypothetical protein
MYDGFLAETELDFSLALMHLIADDSTGNNFSSHGGAVSNH